MELLLQLNMQSFWHAGTGLSGGAYADALVLKDQNNLPYLPGKSIKGVLRDAMQTAQDAHWLTLPEDCDDYVEQLFGSEGSTGQGLIKVSSATLPQDDYQALKSAPDAAQFLYTTQYQTSIDAETGTAKAMSLRAIEVCLPCQLEATVELDEVLLYENFDADEAGDIQKFFATNMDVALGFIWAVGASKFKGLGDVVISATTKTSQSAKQGVAA